MTTNQELLDMYNELLKNHTPDEVLALKFGLAETMGVRKHIEEVERLTKRIDELSLALQKYGAHQFGCPSGPTDVKITFTGKPCGCGFIEVLRGQPH